MHEQKSPKKKWSPMDIKKVGYIRDVVQGGTAKLSLSNADPGDAGKPPGQG